MSDRRLGYRVKGRWHVPRAEGGGRGVQQKDYNGWDLRGA